MKVTALCFLLLSVVLVAGNQTYFSEHVRFRRQAAGDCGRANSLQVFNGVGNFGPFISNLAKIVGGTSSQVNAWPWMAALLILENNGNMRFVCGATLIHSRYVLTAAHCLDRELPNVVRFGEHNWSTHQDGARPMDVFVQTAFYHPHYSKPNLLNDIAVLRLAQQIQFSNNISPICLPPPNLNIEGKLTIVTGWGASVYKGPASPVLKEVVVQVVRQSECRKSYPNIPDIKLCAGSRGGGKDSCQGDSGGPLMYQDPITNRYMLVGIVSGGERCGLARYPGLYTRVSKYIKWIMLVVAS